MEFKVLYLLQYGRADVYFFLSVCGPCSRLKAKSQTLLPVRLQEMYDAVSNYQDAKGRDLALPFLKLPLKTVSTEKKPFYCVFSILSLGNPTPCVI